MFLPLHVLTVLSVLFLIVLVLFAWRGSRNRDTGAQSSLAARDPPSSLPVETEREVRALIDQGDREAAVMLVGRALALDRAQAGDLIDRIGPKG